MELWKRKDKCVAPPEYVHHTPNEIKTPMTHFDIIVHKGALATKLGNTALEGIPHATAVYHITGRANIGLKNNLILIPMSIKCIEI